MCARHGTAGSPALWQNFADLIMTEWPTATISSRREVDERRTRGVRQGVSMPEVLIRPAERQKKKGACDAVAHLVIGVEKLKDKKDNVADTR